MKLFRTHYGVLMELVSIPPLPFYPTPSCSPILTSWLTLLKYENKIDNYEVYEVINARLIVGTKSNKKLNGHLILNIYH